MRIREILIKACALFVMSFSTAAFGMDISLSDINPYSGEHEPKSVGILLKGEIVPGDYPKLLRFLLAQNMLIGGVPFVLASPGGDVSEALKIAKFVKGTYAHVFVGPVTGKCASACFLIYASAVSRFAVEGTVGIHRPYVSAGRMKQLSPKQARELAQNALDAAEAYLRDLRIPQHLVDAMFGLASTDIHWLSTEEINQTVGLRPAWYDEFLIARCGLNKQVERAVLAGADGEIEVSEKDKVLQSRAQRCGQELARTEAEDFQVQEFRKYGLWK